MLRGQVREGERARVRRVDHVKAERVDQREGADHDEGGPDRADRASPVTTAPIEEQPIEPLAHLGEGATPVCATRASLVHLEAIKRPVIIGVVVIILKGALEDPILSHRVLIIALPWITFLTLGLYLTRLLIKVFS